MKRPDYAVDYYFIATAVGRVWVWSEGDGFGEDVAAGGRTGGAYPGPFGIRSEVNVLITETGAVVTTPI